MGRLKTNVASAPGDNGPGWGLRYRTEWGGVVGGRVRRLRELHGWTLAELSGQVAKPEGSFYSAGYFSRMERGWASPPLWVYVRVADVFGVAPGKLLGVEDLERTMTPEQEVLLGFLERMDIEPLEAITRLADPTC